MSGISRALGAGKSTMDTPAERELMLSKLRLAATRAKFKATFLEDLQIGLRQKALTCADVHARLQQEGITL